ncbi:MAG TPA: sodium/calcium exchanger protein [Candidatus Bathyarchaeia archaeon]|nr:sodium/calcium exchanger protein [Candidatus Bathyarchaeia archaeon]
MNNKNEAKESSTEISKEIKEKHVVELEEETEHTLWSVIKLPWYEYVIVGLLLAVTIAMYILYANKGGEFFLIGKIITSVILGIWLAFRPSEWAVDGLDNLMRAVGLTAYVAGVISSIASNLPEAIAAGIMLIKGKFIIGGTVGEDLIHTAFYTTLAAAGFNAILLGIVVLVGGKRKGYIEIKKETVMAEGVLLRWGFVATLLTFGLAIIIILDEIFTEIHAGTNFPGIEGITAELPRMTGAVLVLSYIIYMIFLIVKSREARAAELHTDPIKATKPTRSKLNEKMPEFVTTQNAQRKILDTQEEINIVDPHSEETIETYSGSSAKIDNPYAVAPTMKRPNLGVWSAVILVLLGIGGVVGGGFLLSNAVEGVLHETDLSIGLIALIVGFSGAVPEHGIAVMAAVKGKTDVALGNILGGMLQMTLLIFGLFAIIVPAPINDFMLFQLIALAGILWFVKRSITDDNRLTSFEGIMVILAQTFAFLLLILGLPGII